MVYERGYFQKKCLATILNVGYNNVGLHLFDSAYI